MRLRLLSVLLVVFLLAACGGSEEDPPQAAGDGAAQPDEPILCPLTGLEAPGDFQQDRPALAVKLDNAPPARPQAGIQQADIVYEELSEGGLTRFLSIYHCNDADSLGPIRSARTADADIMQEYAPVLFAYSGANSQVLSEISSASGITDLVHGSNGDAYTRESSRRAPYNLFSSSSSLREIPAVEEVTGAPQPGFEFDEALLNPAAQAPDSGESPGTEPAAPAPAGNSVSFSYSNSNNVRFTYDPAAKAYLRFHGDTAHKAADGNEVRVVNVVVLKVQVVPGTVTDASGSPTMDTTVTGTGDATFLRGGVAVTGKWNRPSVSSKTALTDASGQPVKLAPGNTWVHLVPSERPVTVG